MENRVEGILFVLLFCLFMILIFERALRGFILLMMGFFTEKDNVYPETTWGPSTFIGKGYLGPIAL